MEQRWKKYLLYASLIIVGGGLLFLLEETIRLRNTGFGTKTLWDWMELLIIPLFLAGGAFFLNRSERNTEHEIATDRQQEAALQAYLDRMAELLLEEKLRTTKKDEVRDVARTRTLTVLRGLDARRKRLVIIFLHEAKLISKEKTIVNLEGADLTDANLRDANLIGAHLSEVNLQGAILEGTNLKGANLRQVNLLNANLAFADLTGANLDGVALNKADWLRKLGPLPIGGGVLRADFLKDFRDTANLKGTIMPDGRKHE